MALRRGFSSSYLLTDLLTNLLNLLTYLLTYALGSVWCAAPLLHYLLTYPIRVRRVGAGAVSKLTRPRGPAKTPGQPGGNLGAHLESVEAAGCTLCRGARGDICL